MAENRGPKYHATRSENPHGQIQRGRRLRSEGQSENGFQGRNSLPWIEADEEGSSLQSSDREIRR